MRYNDDFRNYYASLSDDKLRLIAIRSADLRPDARLMLLDELQRRGIRDVADYQVELDARTNAREEYLNTRRARVDKRHRLALKVLCLMGPVMILTGLWVLYVKGDERNGIGILIASLLSIPIYLAILYVRRVVWRFMLRS